MRIHAFALGCAMVLFAGSAFADDPMVNTYGNTVTTVSKTNGAKGTLLFNQDGTYGATATGADGKSLQYTGKWELKDNGATICLTPNAPAGGPAPAASCSPLQKHAVGDAWTVTNNQNETFDVSLTAGR